MTFVFNGVVISGEPSTDGDGFSFASFKSFSPGYGYNAELAVEKLKQNYGSVTVISAGPSLEAQYVFWRRMLEKGLVDQVRDSDGLDHYSFETMEASGQLDQKAVSMA
jgi:hypothetical protein